MALGALIGVSQKGSASVPTGFTETALTGSLRSPTAMAIAPDGRIFVTEQHGGVRIIKNGVLIHDPFATLAVSTSAERGLLGIAFDPKFTSNHYVYLYHTVATAPVHNRVARFTANGDRAVARSGVAILDLDNVTTSSHNGGAIHFGPDGMLYVAVGDNAHSHSAQRLDNRFGKILRILPSGYIPSNNPFFHSTTGLNRAIWALGLRNPFTFAFLPGTSRMFINDVGESTWEEVNDGIAGANYGWPKWEGPSVSARYESPLYAYAHGTGPVVGCAIAGGAFYQPATTQFPSRYVGDYFFADLCSGWIRNYDLKTGIVTDFASGITNPVDVTVSPDGSLYYLAYATGSLFRVTYSGI
jgi:glucose/arabinose dehydrogenase